jgi:hypothetical protein
VPKPAQKKAGFSGIVLGASLNLPHFSILLPSTPSPVKERGKKKEKKKRKKKRLSHQEKKPEGR